MRLSEAWEEQVYEDYFIYLEQVDPDIIPMSYEAFEWIKLREAEQCYVEVFTN